MSLAATSRVEMTVEEYLAAEALWDIKHEYADGLLYAMAGASEAHNRIATNLVAALHARLRGRPCEAFGSDMKLRLYLLDSTFFYYPDAMVACDPTDTGHGWRERPAALFEILSEDRVRDERDKRWPYLQIPSLFAYARIEQTRAEVAIDSRHDAGWETQTLTGADAVLRIPRLELEIPLAELYERVTWPAEK